MSSSSKKGLLVSIVIVVTISGCGQVVPATTQIPVVETTTTSQVVTSTPLIQAPNPPKIFTLSGQGSKITLSPGERAIDTTDQLEGRFGIEIDLHEITSSTAIINFRYLESCNKDLPDCPTNGQNMKVEYKELKLKSSHSALFGTVRLDLISLSSTSAKIKLIAPSGDIDKKTLIQHEGNVRLSGTAIGVDAVTVSVGLTAKSSREVDAAYVHGRWTATINDLPAGNYPIVIQGSWEVPTDTFNFSGSDFAGGWLTVLKR